MATADIRAAVGRVQSVLTRRPELGLHADTAAVARWHHDVSVIACHPNGTEFRTDMPPELGGKGEAVTPGWLTMFALYLVSSVAIIMAFDYAWASVAFRSARFSGVWGRCRARSLPWRSACSTPRS